MVSSIENPAEQAGSSNNAPYLCRAGNGELPVVTRKLSVKLSCNTTKHAPSSHYTTLVTRSRKMICPRRILQLSNDRKHYKSAHGSPSSLWRGSKTRTYFTYCSSKYLRSCGFSRSSQSVISAWSLV